MPPRRTRVGLVLPGLGHLLVGEWIAGLTLLSVVGLLVWSALAGFGRLDEVLHARPGGRVGIHPVVALVSWVGLVVGVWWLAFERTRRTDRPRSSTLAGRFVGNRTGMLGLLGVVVLATFTLLTPLLAPFDPDAIDSGPKNTPPTWLCLVWECRPEVSPTSPLDSRAWRHLLGTDEFGRDLFSRLLYGGRISLSIGFVAVSIAASIGTALGAVSAYAGGWVDRAVMWFVDLMLSLPRLVLLLAIIGMFRITGVQGLFLVVAVLGLTGWMGVCRIVRSEVLSLKQQDFIQAARALGMSSTRIVFRHLVPNAMAPVIVFCSLAVGSTILAEAGLSFLGLGVPPPTSTWGTLVDAGREPLRVAPWIATSPGLTIAIAVMSFNLLGDGLRDSLDPKMRR